jgi:hypothetical protein
MSSRLWLLVIRWNGAPLETKFVVPSLLATLIPASLTDSAGTATVTVSDGGKTSNGVLFTVFGPEETWTPVLDSQAVTFGQVNPLFPDSVVSDWQAGVVFVDHKRLRQDGITPVDPNLKRTDSQDGLTLADSVEQARNECAPAAVANSMEYLKVKDKLENVPNNQADSRVAALDRAMGYSPALGTAALNILQGKLNYIQQKKLALVTESQGRFCPTASIDPKCPGGQNGSDAVTPTVDFITTALTDKKDVELCFAWAAKPATPTTAFSPPGAHCVFVTGYRFVFGFLRLDATQDLDQGNRGGVGWEAGGHVSMTIGTFNNQLWIKNWFGRTALVTHAITEGPK